MDDKFENFEELKAYLGDLPMTWYPSLIAAMVTAAYAKKVFVPCGASHFIAGLEDTIPVASRALTIKKRVSQERERAVKLVMDLFFALREIEGKPSLRDIVKLAKRIRTD